MKNTDRIITTVLSKMRSQKTDRQMSVWVEHLDKDCSLPLEMYTLANDVTGEVKNGDTVIVNGPICAYLKDGGIIVSATHKGKYAEFELHYLRVKDKNSHDFVLIEAYRKWYDAKYGITTEFS